LRKNTIIKVLITAIMLANLGVLFFGSVNAQENEILGTLSKQPMLSQEGFSVGDDIVGILVDPKDNVFYTWEKRVNDTITINVTVANIAGLAGLNFEMYFNSSLIRCTDFEENLFHTVTPQSSWDNIWELKRTIDNTNGYIEYAVLYQDLTRALSEGHAPINITAPEYPEGKLAAAILTFSIVQMPAPNGYVDCPLQIWAKQPYDILGNVIIWELVDGYYKLVSLSGDLNDDGIVDIFDTVLFAEAFGSVPLSSSWNARADMNNDGIIDIFDALILVTNFGKPTTVP
jgi:Dockerin type I domain